MSLRSRVWLVIVIATLHPSGTYNMNATADVAQDAAVVIDGRVDNAARVDASIVRAAQREAARVFKQAGVVITWSEAPAASAANRVHVRLLAAEDAKRVMMASEGGYRVVAQASSEARRVYVDWGGVHAAAIHAGRNPSEVLGIVLAHELGHLLLPGYGHGATGLMRARYTTLLAGDFRFTAHEASLMQQTARTWNAGLKDRERSAPPGIAAAGENTAYGIGC